LKETISDSKLEAIEWRLLESAEKRKSFVEGLERVDPPRVDKSLYSFFKSFINRYLESEAPQRLLFDVAKEYGSSFMQSFTVKLALKTSKGVDWENYVSIDIDRLTAYEKRLERSGSSTKCLCVEGDRIGMLILYVVEGEREPRAYIEYIDKSEWMKAAESNLERYLRFLEKLYSNAVKKLRKESGGRRVSIVDYYFLLDENCYYKDGRPYGAYHVIKLKGVEE